MPIYHQTGLPQQASFQLDPFKAAKSYQRLLKLPHLFDDMGRDLSEEAKWRALSPYRYGSTKGGPTPQQLQDITTQDFWTTEAPKAPLTEQNVKYFPNRLGFHKGSITLDLLDWDQTTAEFAGPWFGADDTLVAGYQEADALPGFIQGPMSFLRTKDIDALTNGPTRFLDYAVAPVDLLYRSLTGTRAEMLRKPDGTGYYPFQETPGYWSWLRTNPSDAQLDNMARRVTSQMGYNPHLIEQLKAVFKQDISEQVFGWSSGNEAIDYAALSSFQTEREMATDAWQRKFKTQRDIAAWSFGSIPTVAPSGTGHLELTGLPFGTELARLLSPIKPETEAAWKALPAKERVQRLQAAGMFNMATTFLETLPVFAGFGAALEVAARGPAWASTAARSYSALMKTTNLAMAWGMGTALANWSLEAALPWYEEEFGRYIDHSRLVSSSSLAAEINFLGYWASGTLGGWTLLKGTKKLGGATLGKVIDFGTPDLRIHVAMGGSRGRDILGGLVTPDGVHPYSKVAQDNAVRRVLLSYGMRQLLNMSAREVEAALKGGLIDEAEAIRLVSQAANNQEHSLSQLVKAFVISRLPEPVLMTDQQRRALLTFRRIAREFDDRSAELFLREYGDAFFEERAGAGDVASLRNYVIGRIKAQHPGIDTTPLEKALGANRSDWLKKVRGDNRNDWLDMARRVHHVEYDVTYSKMHELAREPDPLTGQPAEEADRLILMRSRTLTLDEAEELIDALVNGSDEDAVQAVQRFIGQTDQGAQWYADRFRADTTPTPQQALTWLEAYKPILPTRRHLPDPANDTAALPLNAFHRTLREQGVWDIGYKPAPRTVPKPIYDPQYYRDLGVPPPPPDYHYPAITSAPPGYREVQVGELVGGIRRPIYAADGKVYVNLRYGEQALTQGDQAAWAFAVNDADTALDVATNEYSALTVERSKALKEAGLYSVPTNVAALQTSPWTAVQFETWTFKENIQAAVAAKRGLEWMFANQDVRLMHAIAAADDWKELLTRLGPTASADELSALQRQLAIRTNARIQSDEAVLRRVLEEANLAINRYPAEELHRDVEVQPTRMLMDRLLPKGFVHDPEWQTPESVRQWLERDGLVIYFDNTETRFRYWLGEGGQHQLAIANAAGITEVPVRWEAAKVKSVKAPRTAKWKPLSKLLLGQYQVYGYGPKGIINQLSPQQAELGFPKGRNYTDLVTDLRNGSQPFLIELDNIARQGTEELNDAISAIEARANRTEIANLPEYPVKDFPLPPELTPEQLAALEGAPRTDGEHLQVPEFVVGPEGVILRAPWLDYPMGSTEAIKVGNRNMLLRKMDSAFTGVRTWRLTEYMRSTLHRQLSGRYGLDPRRIDILHEKLLAQARDERSSVQGLTAGLTHDSPLSRAEVSNRVTKTAIDLFGEGPFVNRLTGEVEHVDWLDVIRKSYQGALHLNLTAGATSRLKAFGPFSSALIQISEGWWPSIRFRWSPIFKASEYVESAVLNAMRGVNPFADPLTTAVYYRAGIGQNFDQLGELWGDPLLANIGRPVVAGTHRAQEAAGLGFAPAIDPDVVARKFVKVRGEFDPEQVKALWTPEPSRASAYGLTLSRPDPELYPPTLPPETPQHLLHSTIDPVDQTTMLDYSAALQDEQRVTDMRAIMDREMWERMVRAPEAAAASIMWLHSLPGGSTFVERLAYGLRPTSTHTSSGTSFIDGLRAALEQGRRPSHTQVASGRHLLKLEPSIEGTPMARLTDLQGRPEATRTSIGHTEIAAGFGDARYGSSNAVYSGGLGVFVLKPHMWRRSVTTTGDRMYLSNHQSVGEFLPFTVSAQGAHELNRLSLMRVLAAMPERPHLTLWEALRTSDVYSGTHPVELAWPDGFDWADIEALAMTAPEMLDWQVLVAKYGTQGDNSVPELDDIKVILTDTDGGQVGALWRNALDNAGLTDYTDLSAGHDIDFTEGLNRLPPDFIREDNVNVLASPILNRLEDTVGYVEPEWSILDHLQLAANRERDTLRAYQRDLDALRTSSPGYGRSNRTFLEASIKGSQNTIANIEEIRARYAALFDAYGGRATWDDKAFVDALLHIDKMALDANIDLPDLTGREVLRRESVVTIDGTEYPLPLMRQYVEPQYGSHSSTGVNVDGRVQDTDPAWRVALLRPQVERYQREMARGLDVTGYRNHEPVVTKALKPEFVDAEFLRALKRRADAASALDQPLPIIEARIWHDADQSSQPSSGRAPVVLNVIGPDGGMYGGLHPTDVFDAFYEYGLPARQSAALDALGGDIQKYVDDIGPEGVVYIDASPDSPFGYFVEAFRTTPMRSHPTLKAELLPDGRWSVTLDNYGYAYPLRVEPGFSPEMHKWTDLLSGYHYGKAYEKVTHQMDYDTVAFQNVDGSQQWQYDIMRGGNSTEVDMPSSADYNERQVAMWEQDGRIDSILTDAKDHPDSTYRIVMTTPGQIAAYKRAWLRGHVPDNVSAIDNVTELDRYPEWVTARMDYHGQPLGPGLLIDEGYMLHQFGTPAPVAREAQVAVNATGPGAATPPGPQEALMEGVDAVAEMGLSQESVGKGRLRTGWDAFWNPTPWKFGQEARTQARLMEQQFPAVLKQAHPDAYQVYADLGVPDNQMSRFIVEDREAMQRFIDTGDVAALEAHIAHATKFGLPKGKTTQQVEEALQAFYGSEDWQVLSTLWRMNLQSAQTEAFAVHFFNQFRSPFERSINHPVLGVYPFSWSYKVATEWAKFLFQNRTFGINIGMTPAVAISKVTRMQAEWFAQNNDETLEDALSSNKTLLGNGAFMFNLLMPGDWSSIPFPWSRPIRDIMRGKFDPQDTFQATMGGMARDADLLWRLFGSGFDAAANAMGVGEQKRQLDEYLGGIVSSLGGDAPAAPKSLWSVDPTKYETWEDQRAP